MPLQKKNKMSLPSSRLLFSLDTTDEPVPGSRPRDSTADCCAADARDNQADFFVLLSGRSRPSVQRTHIFWILVPRGGVLSTLMPYLPRPFCRETRAGGNRAAGAAIVNAARVRDGARCGANLAGDYSTTTDPAFAALPRNRGRRLQHSKGVPAEEARYSQQHRHRTGQARRVTLVPPLSRPTRRAVGTATGAGP